MSAIIDVSHSPDLPPVTLEEGKLFFDFATKQLLIGNNGNVESAVSIDHLLTPILDQNESHKTLSSKDLYKVLLNKVDLRHSNKFTGMNEFPYLKVSTAAPSQLDVVVTIRMLEDYLDYRLAGLAGGGGVPYTLPAAINYLASMAGSSSYTLGGIIAGNGLVVDSKGLLSAKVGTTLKFTADGSNSSFLDVKTATDTTLGVVKVGSGLSIDGAGLLTADAQALTPATTTVLGGIKVGARLTVTVDGTLSADVQAQPLSPATTTILGGVIIKDGLSVDVTGNLSTNLRCFEVTCTGWDTATDGSNFILPPELTFVSGGGNGVTTLRLQHSSTLGNPVNWSGLNTVANTIIFPTASRNVTVVSSTQFDVTQITTSQTFKLYFFFLV
jgi:hypothetical protein